MALPASIDPTKPGGSDPKSQGDDQIRALKQFIADIFGLPVDPTNMTAALMSVTAAGLMTVLNDLLLQKASPLLEIDATTGNVDIVFTATGVKKARLRYDTAADEIQLVDEGAGTRVSWSMFNGSQLLGGVPLSRLSASAAEGYPQSGTGGENKLRTMRGSVAAGGSISAGGGFTITKGAAGIYTINHLTSFASKPSIVASCIDGPRYVNATAVAGSATVLVYNEGTNALEDGGFEFITIGPA